MLQTYKAIHGRHRRHLATLHQTILPWGNFEPSKTLLGKMQKSPTFTYPTPVTFLTHYQKGIYNLGPPLSWTHLSSLSYKQNELSNNDTEHPGTLLSGK